MKYLSILILVLIILYTLYYASNGVETLIPSLDNEGYYYYKTYLNLDNLTPIEKRIIISDEILKLLPADYVFLNYYYYIKGCSLSTFHRDVTSGQKYRKSIYPTYTAIIYEYDGDFLSLCPYSHNEYPFIWSRSINISGTKNTIVIFNSDILHSGIINKIGKNRKVLQFKIVHKDDYHLFEDLNKVAVDKDSDCNLDYNIEYIFRCLSLYFAWFINGILYPLMQKKLIKD